MMDTTVFTQDGKYLMLALDHRGSIKKLISPEAPDRVTDQELIDLKSGIINSVKDQVSGLLIDETVGLAAYPEHQKPFLLPMEGSGYTENLGERVNKLGYQALDLLKLGAEGAKLLIYFNPDVASATQQVAIAKQALTDCQANNLPLFLEIRAYKPDTGDELGDKTQELILGSLKMLQEAGVNPDVWKLEYPGSLEGCQKVTAAVDGVPWVLLTKGASFETFVEELKVSKAAGCRGFLAGRALWQEVGSLSGVLKEEFLNKTLPERFKQLVATMSP